MRAVTVSRGGDCLGGTCSQHYVYEWDEVGRLSRARRWDTDAADADKLAIAAAGGQVLNEAAARRGFRLKDVLGIETS